MTFADLQLNQRIQSILSTQGFDTPTAIQAEAIPVILGNHDVLASAQTGTGKTAAFALPILHSLELSASRGALKALILAPTRELALQTYESMQQWNAGSDLHMAVIYGGVPYETQIDALGKNPDVIVATPGRLIDLWEQGHISFADLMYFVLDEVDQMLDLGFQEAIALLAKQKPETCRSLFFSATMPAEIKALADAILKDPVYIAAAPVASTLENIDQSLYFAERDMMDNLLIHLVRKSGFSSGMVFTRSRKVADILASHLTDAGFPAEAFHSDRSQAAREYILGRFKTGETKLLVATDIAARGIHVDGLSHVFNYGLPQMSETYIHRIGRTGRAGACGIALTIAEPQEYSMFTEVQKLMKRNVPVVGNHPFVTLTLQKALIDVVEKQNKPKPAAKGSNNKKKRYQRR